jgi:hypothetical protein
VRGVPLDAITPLAQRGEDVRPTPVQALTQ